MEPVSSVAAFVARYAQDAGADPTAAAILAELSDDERAVIDAQAQPARHRPEWLRARTGRDWSAARLAHVEAQVFVHLRRALQRRGLLRP